MIQPRKHYFSLHELLTMAALAALGGVSSAAVSNVRAVLHAVVPSPIGIQPLAGIHVLWPVLAAGLVRKSGAATITGLLAGTVEMLSGNPHGLLVVVYGVLGGLGVDVVWLLLGGRHRVITYVLAGGVGAATNVLVFVYAASLPAEAAAMVGAILLAAVAFASGTVLAGLLGWWLLEALRRAGAIGAPGQRTTRAEGADQTVAPPTSADTLPPR